MDSIILQNGKLCVNQKFLFKPQKSNSNLSNKIKKHLQIGSRIIVDGIVSKARDKRNPGEFDYKEYLESKEVVGIITVKNYKLIESNKFNILNTILQLRYSINDKIEKHFPDTAAALINGLLLANRKDIDHETMEYFINSGVVHVLAVSGLHVGFIILIFYFLLSRTNIFAKYITINIGLLIFIFLTNFQPSVIRASVMAFVVLLSLAVSRKYNGLNSLAIAAFIILIFDPRELFSPGFQLSFSAVMSIMILYPILSKSISYFKINEYLKKLLLFVSVSFAATVGTLPFTIYYFHKLSMISLLANLFVIPLIGFILGLAIATISFSYLWMLPAKLFANTTVMLINILYSIVNFFGNSNYSFINISTFTLYDSLLYYLIILLFYSIKKNVSMKAKVIIVSLLLLNYLAFEKIDNQEYFDKGKLSVLMIDVGQGDSFLVMLPDQKVLLIDAGANMNGFDNGEKIIVPLLKYLRIKQIDTGIISHLDNDHSGGFNYLIEKGYVKEILKPEVNPLKLEDVNLETIAKNKNVNIKYYKPSIIKGENYRIYILNKNSSNRLSTSENEKSGIIKLVFGKTSFLFVGDAGIQTENELIQRYDNFLQTDVLKLGHHGSKYSSSDEFLSKVSPKIALISVGANNRFGHPSIKVLASLLKRKIHINRTDLRGYSALVSDGNKIAQREID